jgi:hypothetical protein
VTTADEAVTVSLFASWIVICGCVENGTPAVVPIDAREITNLVGAFVTVKVNVRDALPVAFVAVIVYAVELWVEVGVPLNCPVELLKVKPAGAAGEIA